MSTSNGAADLTILKSPFREELRAALETSNSDEEFLVKVEELRKWLYTDIADLVNQIKQDKDLNSKKMSETTQAAAGISLKEVVALLNTGHTRYKKDDKGHGSVQEKLNLTFTQAKELFSRPELKGMKVKLPGLVIINDLDPKDETKEVKEQLFS